MIPNQRPSSTGDFRGGWSSAASTLENEGRAGLLENREHGRGRGEGKGQIPPLHNKKNRGSRRERKPVETGLQIKAGKNPATRGRLSSRVAKFSEQKKRKKGLKW